VPRGRFVGRIALDRVGSQGVTQLSDLPCAAIFPIYKNMQVAAGAESASREGIPRSWMDGPFWSGSPEAAPPRPASGQL